MLTVIIPKKKTLTIDKNGEIEIDSIEVLDDSEIDLWTEELTKKRYKNHGDLLKFLLWSFLRIGEALALRWEDINFETHQIHIYKAFARVRRRDEDGNRLQGYEWKLTPPKTRSGHRKIYICDKGMECLKALREKQKDATPTDYIYVSRHGNPINNPYLQKVLNESLERCGIQKHITLHGLRHSGISYFLRHGVQDKVISEMAGHANVNITDEIYYGVVEEQKAKAIEHINALDHNKSGITT